MTRKTIPNSKSAILPSIALAKEGSNQQSAIRSGSAIILAIVLTTLLAMVGVLFLLSSRVDSVATSAIGGNEDLKLAVDTVVAKISEVLTRDVPGVDPNGTYYDYPDGNNPWLASLEPNDLGVWPHVTDLYYPQLGLSAYYLVADVNYEHKDHAANGIQADADGDGASDSRWVQVPGKMSAKGKPIYAAVRVIDNGGMLNVNTGYKFDPCTSVGSTQLDINLVTLSYRPSNPFFPYNSVAENTLRLARNPSGLPNYENNVIWRYGLPNGAYTPFDISDELEMRYRFVTDQKDTHTRLESWSNQFDSSGTSVLWEPFDNSSGANVPRDWRTYTHYDDSSEPNYAYRHIATTYNLDRIINPNGNKMFNINNLASVTDVNIVRNAIRAALDPNLYDANYIAVNLIDYLDTDSNVTFFVDPYTSNHYFGFETPCIYISEIAQNFYKPDSSSPDYDANDPNRVYRSYAIELFKPYWQDDDQSGWYIETQDDTGAPKTIPIIWTGSRRFHVLENINAAAKIPIEMNEPNEANIIEPNIPQFTPDINFGPGTYIRLWRDVNGYGPMIVDSLQVPDACSGGWMDQNSSTAVSLSFERDIASIHRCIRKVLSPTMTVPPTIGFMNTFVATGTEMIQAHPQNGKFTNVGEIGQLFRTDAYLTGSLNDEASVRLNIADQNFQNIFKYLTVIDPTTYTLDPNQTKIKGRININTAPWFVLAQLPWVSYHTTNYELARSIVNYRDTIHGPFRNIGELMTDANSSINSIGYYEGETMPIPTTLLTPTDGVGDKFEERDVIFDRISNLITVRSDVFTAYILVRIGTDGPQKRVVAILDRSGVTPTGGKVKIVAIQQVPDPR